MLNSRDAYYLSSIGNDVLHSTIQCQELDASLARFSTVFISDSLTTSTLKASSFTLNYLDLSEANISTLRTNAAFTSSQTWNSDLSGGLGSVIIRSDASGVRVLGDPIVFQNLVYFTSTITIVPVSTVVDVDIFSQNGYFSTLSSGSISSGALQTSSLLAHNAFMSTLTVSSITTTDISGFSPTTWSLYPTLNSSITFQPGNVLSNIGNKLYFAGQELTDASGGGQNWSAFPALQDVSMNNFSLRALSTLQYQDGARLYSQTGNNLFYNGQPISYGPSGNASNWSLYPAKTNIVAGNSTITVGNIQNNGSNITNGNTFTNSLGVGGLSLVPIASITSGGDLSCRNIDVGDSVTGLADVNIYGATAAPGDNALYVEGGVTFSGGNIHGFTAGVLPVAGINTGRIDMLQAGFNLLHPLVGAITTGTAMSLTAGAAISMAAGGYLEVNTSTIQCINTTQGNKNTTLQTGFLTIDPDLAATSSIKLFNVLGGGVEIDGGGQGSLQGFSTVQSQFISSLSTNANTSRVNQEFVSTMFANFILCQSSVFNNIAVNNIKIADDITGVTNAPNPNQSRLLNFSTVNSFNVSTTDLWVSSINGAAPGGGGGGPTVSSFITLTASNATISTLSAVGGLPLNVKGFLEFETPNSINNVVNINTGLQIPTLTLQAQNIVLASQSNTLTTSLSTTRLKSVQFYTSSLSTTTFVGSNTIVSTLSAEGGLSIKVNNPLEFITLNGITNVDVINTNGPAVPVLAIAASTIQLNTNNVGTQSLSTNQLQTSSFLASTTTAGLYGGVAVGVSSISTVQLALSTIQMYEQSGTAPAGPSSLMNIGYGYDISGGANGFWLENYINTVDNLDFGLIGNADGAYIRSWQNGRSSYSELFLTGNTMTLGVDTSVIIDDNNGNDFTEIGPTYISTQALAVSTINDVVFPQQPIYCEFTTTSTITVSGSNIPTVIPLDTTNIFEGINLDAGDVELLTAGTYLYTFNVQLDKTGGGIDICDLWLRVNGTDYGGTGSRISVQGNTGQCLAVCSFVLRLNAGDKIALVFASPDTTMAATYFPAWSTPGDPYDRPDIPAVIVTVQKIG